MNKPGLPFPVSTGQIIEIEISSLGHNGEGVGRYRELTIFVDEVIPGEFIEAEISEVKKNYARARLVRVITPSLDRVDPPCPFVSNCGGCQLQHVSYSAQLALKRQRVVDVVERIGKLSEVMIHPTLGMQDPWYYRNKAQFPVGWRSGKVIAGFFAPGSHRIVDIDECEIQHPLGNRIMQEVRRLAADFGIRIYDERLHRGILRHVLFRVGRGTGEAMAVLVTNGADFPRGEQLAEALIQRIPDLVSVIQNINPARTNVVLGRENRVLAGKNSITDFIGSLEFTISPASFFQVNPDQTEVLYGKVLEYAALSGKETVLDVYCGIGTISLFLARTSRTVIGIEVIPEAIEDARTNAARNGITNVRFICGDATAELPKIALEGSRVDVIVVDPPRKGCDEPVLQAMTDLRPERIVYVSCNPASLARDLQILAAKGYRTIEIQPIDMFPHTAHVECCAVLHR